VRGGAPERARDGLRARARFVAWLAGRGARGGAAPPLGGEPGVR